MWLAWDAPSSRLFTVTPGSCAWDSVWLGELLKEKAFPAFLSSVRCLKCKQPTGCYHRRKKCLKKKRLVDGDMQAWSLVKKGLNCWKIATQAFSSWKEIASNDVNLILICKFLFSDKENGPRRIGWLHFQIFYLYCRDLFSLDWYHTSEPGPWKEEQSHRQCAVRLSTISWTQHMQHTCAWKVSSHQELWADCSA